LECVSKENDDELDASDKDSCDDEIASCDDKASR
jgi:hypothetical protein